MSLLHRLRTALKRYLEARSLHLSERKRWSNHVRGEGNVSPEMERAPSGQALVATLPEPVPVSALPGDDPSRIREISNRLLSEMRRVARQDGWALAVHGSMARDLDIVAVPWTDQAADETAFVEAMRAAVARELAAPAFIGAGNDGRTAGYEDKPHGRRCWTIHSLSEQLVETERGAHPYVDLAVLDFRSAANGDAPDTTPHPHPEGSSH